jgi:hypothetical protein
MFVSVDAGDVVYQDAGVLLGLAGHQRAVR